MGREPFSSTRVTASRAEPHRELNPTELPETLRPFVALFEKWGDVRSDSSRFLYGSQWKMALLCLPVEPTSVGCNSFIRMSLCPTKVGPTVGQKGAGNKWDAYYSMIAPWMIRRR